MFGVEFAMDVTRFRLVLGAPLYDVGIGHPITNDCRHPLTAREILTGAPSD
jgi:hypothetical protein